MGMRIVQQNERCSDLDVVPDGWGDPAFRILLPEHLVASNVDVAAGWGVPRILHDIPGRWVQQDAGMTGVFDAGKAFRVHVEIRGRGMYVDIQLGVENLTGVLLENVRADICLNLCHLPGNPGWHNSHFLAHETIERGALGRYWYEKRTPICLQAWWDGEWCGVHPYPDNPKADQVPLYFEGLGREANIYAIESEDGESVAFQMWNVHCVARAPFPGNACFHLKPLMAAKLAPGERSSIRGKAGILRGRRETLPALWTGMLKEGKV